MASTRVSELNDFSVEVQVSAFLTFLGLFVIIFGTVIRDTQVVYIVYYLGGMIFAAGSAAWIVFKDNATDEDENYDEDTDEETDEDNDDDTDEAINEVVSELVDEVIEEAIDEVANENDNLH